MEISQPARTAEAQVAPLASNVLGIDHIAVAVGDLQAAVDWACSRLGCEQIEARETTGRRSGMKGATLRLGGVVIVLVQGTGPESQVTQYVERHGPGVQHIALRVRDMTGAVAALQHSGMEFSTPRLDSERLSQIFSLRNPLTGLMVELIERRNYEGFSDENVQRLFDSLEKQGLY